MPFAVRPTPTVRPDLWPLHRPLPDHVDDVGPPTLTRDGPDADELVAAARRAVLADPGAWTSVTTDLDGEVADAVGWRLAEAIAAERSDVLELRTDHLRLIADDLVVTRTGSVRAGATTDATLAERVRSRPPAHRLLEAIALGLPEDVVLVDRDARAVWVHVCAPSGWDPGTAAGRSLTALHGPVPAADRLRAASAALGRAIVATGPNVRWVWGLTDDPAAAHHPRFRPPPSTAAGPVPALTFRAERQTTLPVPEAGVGVFLIRVHRAPLRDVVTTPVRARRLAAAIASLPPELKSYKGVAGRVDELQAWLATVAGAQD